MGEGFHGHKTVGERPAWTDGRTGRRTDPFVFRVYVFRPRSFLTATGLEYSKGGLSVDAGLEIKGLVPFTQLVKVRRGKLVLALPSIRFS